MTGSLDETKQVLLQVEAALLPSGGRLPHVLRQKVSRWHAQEQGGSFEAEADDGVS